MIKRILATCIVFALMGYAPLLSATANFKGYVFEANVIKANGKKYKEFNEGNQLKLKVRPNEEYSIVVHNPLPVRAAVAVSIDGLNSIDGKRTSTRTARKWLIEPNSSLTVAGWQTSKQTLRKFLFTEQSEAFAQWREEKEGKPFTKNLGVIGIAWFWNSQELEMALRPPQPFVEESSKDKVASESAPSSARGAPAPAAKKAESVAGTGMGRQQQNLVTSVAFEDNAGMYSVKDVLKIYYEFAKEPAEPAPFIDDDEDEGRFTPEMPK
jgi:hypothetical protein